MEKSKKDRQKLVLDKLEDYKKRNKSIPGNLIHFFPYKDKNSKSISKDEIGITLNPGINEVTEEQYKWLSIHPGRPSSYGIIIK